MQRKPCIGRAQFSDVRIKEVRYGTPEARQAHRTAARRMI